MKNWTNHPLLVAWAWQSYVRTIGMDLDLVSWVGLDLLAIHAVNTLVVNNLEDTPRKPTLHQEVALKLELQGW